MVKAGRPRGFDRGVALETAMRLFWEKGFDGTSKRDLMEATGVASQSLYNAFGDKHELFMEAIRHYADSRVGMLVGILEAEGSPLENVRDVVRLWGNPPQEFKKGCLLCNSLAEFGQEDSEVGAFLRAQLTRAQELFEATLEQARAQGELARETDVEALAAQLVCTSHGLSLMRRAGVPTVQIEGVVRATLRLLE